MVPNGASTPGQLPGTSTNDNASTGNVGEYQESSIASGSQIQLTTVTAANITNLSLTAGDWDCSGKVNFSGSGTTVTTDFYDWVSTTSATLPTEPNHGGSSRLEATF